MTPEEYDAFIEKRMQMLSARIAVAIRPVLDEVFEDEELHAKYITRTPGLPAGWHSTRLGFAEGIGIDVKISPAYRPFSGGGEVR